MPITAECPACKKYNHNFNWAAIACGHVFCVHCVNLMCNTTKICLSCYEPACISLARNIDIEHLLLTARQTTEEEESRDFEYLNPFLGQNVENEKVKQIVDFIEAHINEEPTIIPPELTKFEADAVKAVTSELNRRHDCVTQALYRILYRQRLRVDELTGAFRAQGRDLTKLIESLALICKWSDTASQREVYKVATSRSIPETSDTNAHVKREIEKVDSGVLYWYQQYRPIEPRPTRGSLRLSQHYGEESRKEQQAIDGKFHRSSIKSILEIPQAYDRVRATEDDPNFLLPRDQAHITNSLYEISAQLSNLQIDFEVYKPRLQYFYEQSIERLINIEVNQGTIIDQTVPRRARGIRRISQQGAGRGVPLSQALQFRDEGETEESTAAPSNEESTAAPSNEEGATGGSETFNTPASVNVANPNGNVFEHVSKILKREHVRDDASTSGCCGDCVPKQEVEESTPRGPSTPSPPPPPSPPPQVARLANPFRLPPPPSSPPPQPEQSTNPFLVPPPPPRSPSPPHRSSETPQSPPNRSPSIPSPPPVQEVRPESPWWFPEYPQARTAWRYTKTIPGLELYRNRPEEPEANPQLLDQLADERIQVFEGSRPRVRRPSTRRNSVSADNATSAATAQNGSGEALADNGWLVSNEEERRSFGEKVYGALMRACYSIRYRHSQVVEQARRPENENEMRELLREEVGRKKSSMTRMKLRQYFADYPQH